MSTKEEKEIEIALGVLRGWSAPHCGHRWPSEDYGPQPPAPFPCCPCKDIGAVAWYADRRKEYIYELKRLET